MDKRAFKRIPIDLKVRFYCCNKTYTGTITNLTEKGMFISTHELYFPFNSQLEIFIPLKDKGLHIPVNLNRITMSPDSDDGIGVELPNPPQDYLEFVDSLRPAL